MRFVSNIARACAVAGVVPLASLLGQGVTTAAIQGTVRTPDGMDVDRAQVAVVSGATGFVSTVDVRRGRFVVQGLEVGGPYTITVRRLGYRPETRGGVFLTLGEPAVVQFVLQPAATVLDTQRIVSALSFPRASLDGGAATTITDSLLHRLPTLNRDMYDFVRLVPQISTRTGFRTGFSGGGAGLRNNDFLIGGVSERSVFFNASAAFGDGRTVPLDAVAEYQVLLAPYDVRYGDFAGALVNTVTRSGTNQLAGSVFAQTRNDRLARNDSTAPYERMQYGLSLGGPIVRDRLHFFVASELQRFTSPAVGPYVGQPSSSPSPLPVNAADVKRFGDLLGKYGLVAGSGGLVENRNPLAQLFGRLDLAIPRWNSRAILWTDFSRFSSTTFSRARSDSFPLSTLQTTGAVALQFTSMQLRTTLPGLAGAQNELVVSHRSSVNETRADVRQPIVMVSVPGTNGGTVTLVAGTHASAQGTGSRERIFRISDNLTLPLGSNHLATLGLMAEPFRFTRGGVGGSYGTWLFSSLNSLDAAVAERFEIVRDFGSASVPIGGTQYAMFAGDRWLPSDRVAVTLGARADLLLVADHAPYNPEVELIFGRRTDVGLPRRVHLSPRAGFTWDVSGRGSDQLRGGAGMFTGRPPANWIRAALASYGVGSARLACGAARGSVGPAPQFVPDYLNAPTTCADGSGFAAARGDVELLHPQLDMIREVRTSLAWDHRMARDLFATGEALFTRSLSDFTFVNLNLEGPIGVDRNGRVMYGTIPPGGLVAPAQRSPQFPAVIDLANVSRNRSYQLSARVEKRFAHGSGGTASYTYSHVRDVSTPVRTGVRGIVNWSARAVSGRHDDERAGISLNDVPHRVVLAGTYRAPWQRWSTELAFFYVGESGSPFTYVAGGLRERGDLNADGSDANDPIYVPKNVFDTTEIRFTGRVDTVGADNSAAALAARVREQQAAFDRLVRRTPCLERQRGRIMARNSCRDPWTNTTIASIRQRVPIAGRAVEAELQVLNVLNLLRREWGQSRVANPDRLVATAALLEHVEQTDGPPEVSQPVFRFGSKAPRWTTLPAESNFQLQVAARYRF